MYDIPSAALHLVSLRHYLAVLLGSVLVKGLVLTVAQDDALKKGSDLVLGEIVTKFTHFIEKVDILVEDQCLLGLKDGIDEKINMGFLEDVRNLLE